MMETEKTLKILFVGLWHVGLLIKEESFDHGGHFVEAITSPDEARALLSDKNHGIDLLITGDRLEGETGAGMELVRWTKENCPGLKVILMSVFSDNESEALSTGADVFWNTSCEVCDLMQIVDGLFGIQP
jgi:DNA-binding NtrC family response regulator